MLLVTPNKEEVFDTLKEANANAAPGTDGITSLVYKQCWDSLGDPWRKTTIIYENIHHGIWF